MSAPARDRFYFPPPVDIDTRRSTQETVDAIAGQLATQPDLDPIRTVANNTAAIVAQQQQNENTSGGGVNKFLQFGNGAISTTDWTCDPNAFAAANGQMTLTGNVPVNTYFMARANYTFNTDDQALSVMLGDNANNDQPTFIVLRADSSGANGVACRITANSIQVGTIQFPGNASGSPGFTPVIGVSPTLGSGDSIEFRAVGQQYAVYKNGGNILGWSGSIGGVGSFFRSASVVMNKAQAFFVYYSFNLRNFGMYDYGVAGAAITTRKGARLSRLSNAQIGFGVGNGGASRLPTAFFAQIDFATNVVVSDLDNGALQVKTAGWYEVTASFAVVYDGSEGAYYGPAYWAMWVNGTQVLPAAPVGVPVKWAFAVDDVVQVGVASSWSSVIGRNPSSSDNRFGTSGPVPVVAIGGSTRGFFQLIADNPS